MKKTFFVIIAILFLHISWGQHVGEPRNTPYNEAQDKFVNGAMGFDPNLTLEQNEKYYNRQGYNISYKVQDSTIFIFAGIILALIIIGYVYNSSVENRNEKFKTQN